MDWTFIWKSFCLIISGILLLRIAGRKSISQMTLAQTIVIISIGTIIVQPILEKSALKTIGVIAAFVATLVLIEYLEIKFNMIERIITGKSKIVIENGVLNEKNLTKLRLTADQLEMRLRNEGISKIEDIKAATIEPNGLIGYELEDHAKPLTVGEFRNLLNLYFPERFHNAQPTDNNGNLFEEIKNTRAQNQSDNLK